jgi:hypothetical protein
LKVHGRGFKSGSLGPFEQVLDVGPPVRLAQSFNFIEHEILLLLVPLRVVHAQDTITCRRGLKWSWPPSAALQARIVPRATRPPPTCRCGPRVGADKAYDTKDFVSTLRALRITPHVWQNTAHRRSAIDGRTTRHPGYAISLSKRWLVEKPFGWLKQIGPLKKVKLRGLAKVDCSVRERRRGACRRFRAADRAALNPSSTPFLGLK